MVEIRPIANTGKIVSIAITAIVYLLFLFITVALHYILPLWQYILATIILLVVIAWQLIGRGIPSPAGQQAGSSRKYFGWLNLKTIALVIIALVLGYWFWNVANETSDITITGQELSQYTVAGAKDCQNVSNGLACSGWNWKIVIPNKDNIGWVKVYPGEKTPFQALTLQAKSYKVNYYQVKTTCKGAKLENDRLRSKVEIFYNDINITDPNDCENVLVSATGTMSNEIYLGTNYWRLLPIHNSKVPQVYIGGYFVSMSSDTEDEKECLGGNITISPYQGQGATIGKIEVVYSSYSWTELLYKTTGIKI